MKYADKCMMVFCLVACVALTGSLAGCGSDPAPSEETQTQVASASVGSTGGTVEGGGISLVVPEAALAEEVEISISVTELEMPSNWDGATKIYRFEPAGLDFAAPADISFEVDAEDTSQAVVLWSSDDGESWETLDTTPSQNGVTAKVDHFSVGFVGLPRDISGEDAGPQTDTSGEVDAGPAVDTGTGAQDTGGGHGGGDAGGTWADAGDHYWPDATSSPDGGPVWGEDASAVDEVDGGVSGEDDAGSQPAVDAGTDA